MFDGWLVLVLSLTVWGGAMTIMDLAHAAGLDADAQLAGKLQVFALLVQQQRTR